MRGSFLDSDVNERLNMVKHLRKLLSYWTLLERANEYEDTHYNPKDVFKVKAAHDVLYIIDNDKENVTYVVCTGTNWSLFEWGSNLLAWNMRGFHNGFYRTARRMYRKLKTHYWHYDRPVVVLGHSRGVYGVILAYMMEKAGIWDRPHCVTFGAPEAFKKSGIKKMNSSTVTHERCFTKDDFVRKVGASKQWATKETQLPNVEGFDHTSYGRSLGLAITLEEGVQ